MSRVDRLEKGRKAYAKHEWRDAYAFLSFADLETPLGGIDLAMLAESAFLLGGEARSLEILERAYEQHATLQLPISAARFAFWIGFRLQLAGDSALADVWHSRARRQLEACAPCAAHGLPFLALGYSLMVAGDPAAAHVQFVKAFEIGTRFGDRDLIALGLHYRGLSSIRSGQPAVGMALLGESVEVIAGSTSSPVVTGGIFCSALTGCEETMDVLRADRWSTAVTVWRDSQPSMIAFRAESLAHRVSLMQLRGAWRDALDLLTPLIQWLDDRSDRPAAGLAYYQRGELHRLRGEHEAAHAAYREAAARGHKPQPGLSQLLLAQGFIEKAAEEIHRLLVQTTSRSQRSLMLPASVDILLAAGEVSDARMCAEELLKVDAELRTPLSYAFSTHAIGAVLLCEDKPQQSLAALRDARTTWEELGARYNAARTRVLTAAAHRELGDEEAVKAELIAAADAFDTLGAAADRLHAEEFYRRNAKAHEPFLTSRQMDVLRLLALGLSNTAISESLAMSAPAVAKEVRAIFYQLQVVSRTHAARQARRRGLI
jgi:DNA-binding CsgD family transcriptional regulator